MKDGKRRTWPEIVLMLAAVACTAYIVLTAATAAFNHAYEQKLCEEFSCCWSPERGYYFHDCPYDSIR